MKSFTLSQKVALPKLCVLALVAGMLGYLLANTLRNRDDLLHESERVKKQADLLTQLNQLRRDRQRSILSFRYDRDPVYRRTLKETASRVGDLMNELRTTVDSERERALLDKLIARRAPLGVVFESLLKADDEGDVKETERAFSRWNESIRRYDAMLSDFSVLNMRALDRSIARMDASRTQAFVVVGFLLVVTLLLLVGFWLWIRRSLVRPILQMTDAAKAIATGDLSIRVDDGGRGDELGVLARALNEMTQSLARLKEELESNIQELHRSNEDLQQFAFVSSHDLKEPLRVVSLFSQLLEREHDRLSREQTAEYIHHITDGVKRMYLLIDDLLSYSRVKFEDVPLAVVDCNEVLSKVKEGLAVSIAEAQGSLEVEPLPKVLGNEILLKHLFENLLTNAIKFRGDRAPSIRVSAKRLDSQWTLSVTDNGIGIDPVFKDKLFVIFKRLHTRDQYPGSGIGLAICKKIVERHGGRIWVDSAIGKGATFSFTLPQAPV